MILEKFRLQGKVALITGCSSGLGRGMAEGLAEAGADIVGVFNSTQPVDLQERVEALGCRFLGVQADIMQKESIERIVKQTLETFGKIDILVNNAGITRRASALEYTEEEWDAVLDVNLKNLFFLSQAVAKQFIKQGTGGKIINVASMLSYQGGINVTAYTASKSGVLGLTRILANEWAEYNINVNGIAPGYMYTNMTASLKGDEKRNAEIMSRIPAKRWGTPEDLQGVVVFLASEASNYVHGFTLAVDGGWLSR